MPETHNKAIKATYLKLCDHSQSNDHPLSVIIHSYMTQVTGCGIHSLLTIKIKTVRIKICPPDSLSFLIFVPPYSQSLFYIHTPWKSNIIHINMNVLNVKDMCFHPLCFVPSCVFVLPAIIIFLVRTFYSNGKLVKKHLTRTGTTGGGI